MIILSVFFLDRVTKIYLLNLQANGVDIDFYIYPFLNFSFKENEQKNYPDKFQTIFILKIFRPKDPAKGFSEFINLYNSHQNIWLIYYKKRNVTV